MNFIGVAVFIPFLFRVEKSAACNNDNIIAMAGSSVSLEWTFSSTSFDRATSFKIHNSSKSMIVEMVNRKCIVVDHSSTYCNISDRDNGLRVSLTLLNVTARQSGNYTLQLQVGTKEDSNRSKKLVVIGKPKIMEVGKPILGRPFEMTCNSSHELDGVIYRWRINGAQTIHICNGNAHSVPSLLMTDNLSHVTCQVCLDETRSNVSSVICEQDACSIDSDPYTIQVIYGPEHISLSLNESNFYLEEHESFTIDCFANCNPDCTFCWRGHATTESKKLVIARFESKMAGNYTCYVTNQHTNNTSKSNTITLHVKEDKVKDEVMEVIGIGLFGAAVLLVVIGCGLVMQWRKNASGRTDSRTLNEPVVNLRGPTNGKISQGISRIQNRPLPVPNSQEITSRRPYRPKYLNHKRKSRSLHNLLDSAQDFFYPLRSDLSLQLLYSPSNIMGRSRMNGTQEYTSIKERRFSNCEENQPGDMSGLENGLELEFMYAKVKKDKKNNRDEHNAGAKSESLNNLRHESFEQEPQENLYSTIDEDALSVYDDAKNNSTNENSNEEQMNTIHREPDFNNTDVPIL